MGSNKNKITGFEHKDFLTLECNELNLIISIRRSNRVKGETFLALTLLIPLSNLPSKLFRSFKDNELSASPRICLRKMKLTP